VDNYVDNPVDNFRITFKLYKRWAADMDINTLIKAISESFQQFFDEKRYRLIKFAVKVKIVDKVPIVLIFSK
jgi:hypothetical protein